MLLMGRAMKTDSYFKYSKDEINGMIDDLHLRKAIMSGIRSSLEELKPIIEKLYDDNIFYLSDWKSECVYHGWSWNKDDGSMENMRTITDGITQKFEEIYALILSGLGEKIE